MKGKHPPIEKTKGGTKVNDKAKIDEMARKYKEEMMRLYNRSASGKTAMQKPAETVIKPPSAPMPSNEYKPTERKSSIGEELQHNAVKAENHTENNESSSKFRSADDILSGERNSPSAAMSQQDTDMGSNYEYTENNDNSAEREVFPSGQIPDIPESETAVLEPLYKPEVDASEGVMNGTGLIQVEVTAAGQAIPIPNATVIITQKNDKGNSLLYMLITDDSGLAEAVPLPAPDKKYSESPDEVRKPFAEYQVGVYAPGFYTVPEITVPVFSTIKSIQPVQMIPLAELDRPSDSPDSE